MKITLLTGKIFDLENAFDFPLVVRSDFKTKRLSLRIDRKNRKVIFAMPKWYPKKKAMDFINAHIDWIEQKLSDLPQLKDFEDGETIFLFGKQTTICYQQDFGAPKQIEGILYVGGQKEFLHRRVKDYIKREAKKEFLKRSDVLAEKIGCKLEGVTIKDTKSRWGSCSSLKHINYNWRIALAPDETINYLMAHEVAHLKHPDHSADFWKTVKTLYAGASIGRAWLEKNGDQLYLYR